MTGRELYEKKHPHGVRWAFLSRTMQRYFDRQARAMSKMGIVALEAGGKLWARRSPSKSR